MEEANNKQQAIKEQRGTKRARLVWLNNVLIRQCVISMVSKCVWRVDCFNIMMWFLVSWGHYGQIKDSTFCLGHARYGCLSSCLCVFVLTLPKGTHMQFNTWNFYTCEDSGKQMQRFLANPKQKHPNQRFKCSKLFGSFSPQKSCNHWLVGAACRFCPQFSFQWNFPILLYVKPGFLTFEIVGWSSKGTKSELTQVPAPHQWKEKKHADWSQSQWWQS